MDTEQTTSFIAPAYLWVGNHHTILAHTKAFLQKQLCKQNACNTCITCTQILQEQHHAIAWLTPEKAAYTLEQLSIIFETIIFKRDATDPFFFILQKADFLPTLCANQLLKSLEEPPTGYHFILLATQLDAILPTIQSRCLIEKFNAATQTPIHEQLYTYFTNNLFSTDAVSFLTLIESITLHERESVELLDQILAFWIEATKKSIVEQNKMLARNQSIIKILEEALETPAMPGSSKLFWKNIFLQLSIS